MPWNPALDKLRDALAELYPQADDAKRVAADALLAISHIDLQGKGINIWQSILEEAEKQCQVENVLEAALGQYPRHPALGEAARAWRARGGRALSGAPVWAIPHRRNRLFTGREALLAALQAALGAGRPAALAGLGGVGKTQTAVEFAYRHRDAYDVAWWARAEEPAVLAGDYAALAEALGLPEAGAREQGEAVRAALRWLEGHGRWLLILDNAPDADAVRPYLPRGGGGHALLTSRYPAWRGLAGPLEVPAWPPDEAAAFLLARTGLGDAAGAAALAGELGYLPLALEQAGAYVEQMGMSLAQYLELYRARHAELWRKGVPPPDQYPDTVATTWEIGFQGARAARPAAADLLNLCAFLGADEIPRDVLTAGAAKLPAPLSEALADPLSCLETEGALYRYALLAKSEQGLTVHRLVAAVARDRLDEEGQRAWAAAAADLLAEAFPYDSDDVRTWPDCARLLPHALAAAEHAEERGVASEAAGLLLNQAGLYLKGRAQFAEARRCFERALRIDEAAYGPDHPKVATDVNNLGSVLQDLGDLAEARRCFERALRIDEAAYGPDHPKVATDVNNLGSVLQDLGDLAGARGCFERALRIDEAAYGPDHPTVATDVNNLGGVLRDLGDLAGARGCFERALRIDEAAYGPDHPNVATDVNNLGGVLQDLGDLAGARACFERALRLFERFLPPEHPHIRIARGNLEDVLRELGET